MYRPETTELLAVTLLLLAATGAVRFGGPAAGTGEWSNPRDVLEPRVASAQISETWISRNVFRVVDAEAQVVCHVATLSKGAGVACLPVQRTSLRPTAPDGPSRPPPSTEQFVSRNVFRVVDGSADVVCYVATLSEGAGVDCLPLAETTLQQAGDRTEFAIERPTGAYVLGSRTDVFGVAPDGIDSVALYARRADNWSLLDIDEDGILSVADALTVTDGRWGRQGVVLSSTSDVFTTADEYQLGAIDATAALDSDGSLRQTLSPTAFANAPSATVVLDVQPPALTDPTVFQDIGNQVAVEDGVVTVSGVATGTREVLVMVVSARGQLASEIAAVNREGVFDEEFPLLTSDGETLTNGVAVGMVLSPGRDGEVGDGEISDRPLRTLEAYDAYLRNVTQSIRLTQQQIVARVEAETVDDAGSDDLRVVDTFLLTDARTTIESVSPANATAASGVQSVSVGERLVVRGRTNRKPDDNTIFVDLFDSETGAREDLATTDAWGLDGAWTVVLPTDGLDPGTYTVVADDGDSSDSISVKILPANETSTETGANATTATT